MCRDTHADIADLPPVCPIPGGDGSYNASGALLGQQPCLRQWLGPHWAILCDQLCSTGARLPLPPSAVLPICPASPPYAVVLIFGSVELLQDKADPAAFRTALVGIIAHLERKYPAAKIIVAGISHGLDAWRYDNDAAEALNNVLRNLSGTEYLDTACTARAPLGRRHYL